MYTVEISVDSQIIGYDKDSDDKFPRSSILILSHADDLDTAVQSLLEYLSDGVQSVNRSFTPDTNEIILHRPSGRSFTFSDLQNNCPFCGSNKLDLARNRGFNVYCKDCGGRGGRSNDINTALAKWNRRNPFA